MWPGWFRLALIGLLAMLFAPACGPFNPVYHLNNEIRLAVYQYERDQRGPVDELVIDAQRGEPRVKFEGQNQNGGRTIWLPKLGAREYFELRPQDATFLYIQEITYGDNEDVATVKLYRGDSTDYHERELRLRKVDGEGWIVTEDVALQRATDEG